MIEKFEDRNLSGTINIKMDDAKGTWVGDKGRIVSSIVSIANEYMNAGYTLTLRQLYYQLVARDIIPNHDKVYKKIGTIKDDCVYSGLIDWGAFEDRGRVPQTAYCEESVPDSLKRTLNSYKLDRQLEQPVHIEVWTEKDAISSILSKVTRPYSVTLAVNKGYTSSTSIYDSYTRFSEYINAGIPVKILYFGDHDPSGLDMIRDIKERLLFMFLSGEQCLPNNEAYDYWEANCRSEGWNIWTLIEQYPEYEPMERLVHTEYDGGSSEKFENMWDMAVKRWYIEQHNLFEVIPVGLTMAQIKKYNPPHNPAKITDPRAKSYVSQFGQVSWEVDALTPRIMTDIVKESIEKYMDMDVYKNIMKREQEDKKLLQEYIDKANGTSGQV